MRQHNAAPVGEIRQKAGAARKPDDRSGVAVCRAHVQIASETGDAGTVHLPQLDTMQAVVGGEIQAVIRDG